MLVGGLLCCAGVGRSVGSSILLHPPHSYDANPGCNCAGFEAEDNRGIDGGGIWV